MSAQYDDNLELFFDEDEYKEELSRIRRAQKGADKDLDEERERWNDEE